MSASRSSFKESNPNLFKGGIAKSLAVPGKSTRRKTKATRLDMFGDQCLACGIGLLLSMDTWLNHMTPRLLTFEILALVREHPFLLTQNFMG
jgi:hypothetical protein